MRGICAYPIDVLTKTLDQYRTLRLRVYSVEYGERTSVPAVLAVSMSLFARADLKRSKASSNSSRNVFIIAILPISFYNWNSIMRESMRQNVVTIRYSRADCRAKDMPLSLHP